MNPMELAVRDLEGQQSQIGYVPQYGRRCYSCTAQDPTTPIFPEGGIDTLLQDGTARAACPSVQPLWYGEQAQWEDEPKGRATPLADSSFHRFQHEQAERAENDLPRDRAQHSRCMLKPHKLQTFPMGYWHASATSMVVVNEARAHECALTSRGGIIIVRETRWEVATMFISTNFGRGFHPGFKGSTECSIEGCGRMEDECTQSKGV